MEEIKPIKKQTTWQVLRDKFPSVEYILLEEVSDASGFSRSRSLDFMVINLWNSRGLAVTGIERKSNRGDWLKELKNPAKQENHFKYCDYFYLLTDKENVAKLDEIPANWGWYHINENGKFKIMKQAPKLASVPIERSLLCAMLKRAACKQKYVHVDSIEETIQEKATAIQLNKNRSLEDKASRYDDLVKKVQDFENASGINIVHGWDLPKVGEIVRVIMQSGVETHIKHLERLEGQIIDMGKEIGERIMAIKTFETAKEQ